MKQLEINGVGSLSKIRKLVFSLRAKHIFLVTGGNSYESSGAKKILENQLKKFQVTTFNDFEANPKVRDIIQGIDTIKKAKPDIVIAIGGGSVIDVAKAVNSLAANPGDPVDYVTGKSKINKPGKPLIAVPTTAGSGSEATHFAVIYLGNTKYSLSHPSILPTVSIVDPRLTSDLSPRLTAISGLDALTQAIEAYWSINSTTVSKRYSAQAIKLIMGNIKATTLEPTLQSRAAMSLAAHLAGKAINIAKTTACHAISYPLTSLFAIPHGQAVALTLSSMLKYNLGLSTVDCLDKRGVTYVKKILKKLSLLISGSSVVEKGAEKLDKLLDDIGLTRTLGQLKIGRKDIDLIVKNGFNPDRVKNNPRRLTKKSLNQILVKLL